MAATPEGRAFESELSTPGPSATTVATIAIGPIDPCTCGCGRGAGIAVLTIQGPAILTSWREMEALIAILQKQGTEQWGPRS